MLTAIVCVIAGMFIDHFYPVPAQLVREKVLAGLSLVRAWFKAKEPRE